jgi:hypothetical protein
MTTDLSVKRSATTKQGRKYRNSSQASEAELLIIATEFDRKSGDFNISGKFFTALVAVVQILYIANANNSIST